MISIEEGKQHGYKNDRPVLKLTHSFTNKQLLQIAVMAVEACGLDEVLAAIEANRDARPKGHYQLFRRGQALSSYLPFDEEGAIRQAVRETASDGQATQVFHIVAEVSMSRKHPKVSGPAAQTVRFR
jgi:hypothetical protein